jgi:hypothetical protein
MKVSQWLTENAYSHGIFSVEDLDGLAECDNIDVVYRIDNVAILYKDRTQTHPFHTARQIAESIERRGLGGVFDPGNSKYFWIGWELASNLCFLIAMKYSTKGGRGSMFRESVQMIAEAGE